MNDSDRARLRWRCRRGTQELDIMLMRFFDQHYDAMTLPDRVTFTKVLEAQDPELQDWLFGRATPDQPQLAAMVQRIRETPHHNAG